MSLLTSSKLWTTAIPEPDLAVRLSDVSVRYLLASERISSLKEYVIRSARRPLRHAEFYALRDVTLELHRGEALGIIGRNGAGKSTLLKVISRVIRPTGGRVWVRGRVAPLLELGAGFHPELTGRENVFLNGAILGHTEREIRERYESIVDFADLWDFIEAPLRTYSTGMVARLGFAVATAWQPEILILDEVLSVGDAEFQVRSANQIQQFRDRGVTTLFVSHSLEAVRQLCDRAVWLDMGFIQAIGSPDQVIARYQDEALQMHRPEDLRQRWGTEEEFQKARQSGAAYDDYYFQYCCGKPYERNAMWLRLFEYMAQQITRRIAPRSALDVGCAIGLLVEALRVCGVDASGIDISRYAIERAHESVKPYCRMASVLDPLARRYDLVTCIEVLQNLTAEEGQRAIANLCNATDDILFSANPSDRRSPTHVNVQPIAHWESLFSAQGFARDRSFDASFITPWAARFRRTGV